MPQQGRARELPFWKTFVAGNVAGAFGITIAYPLDTIKVRIQVTEGKYNGTFDCLKQMVTKEGWRSLYRGLSSPCMGYGAINAVVFSTNNWATEKLKSAKVGRGDNSPLSQFDLMLGGCAAGFTSSFVRAPIEQIKTVMQGREKQGKAPYRNSLVCAIQVIKTEGVYQGLFRGLISTINREIPQYALYYPCYDLSKQLIRWSTNKDETEKLGPFYTSVCGGLAGVGCWFPTYPIDVVKSRIHVAEPGTYAGFWDCSKQILKTSGLPAFFRGISPTLMRAFPLHGAIFMAYEGTLSILENF